MGGWTEYFLRLRAVSKRLLRYARNDEFFGLCALFGRLLRFALYDGLCDILEVAAAFQACNDGVIFGVCAMFERLLRFARNDSV